MSERFFVEQAIGDGTQAVVRDSEAHHLVRVMRAKEGDELQLFDGSGWEYRGRITQITKSLVTAEIIERHYIDRELPGELTLAVALPKGDRQDFLIEKLVELGATRFIPLETSRGVAKATPQAMERIRRHVIEASKQCRRNRLMRVEEPQSIPQLIRSTDTGVRGFAHPDGVSVTTLGVAFPATFAIGPEGGFSENDVHFFSEAGWAQISLGPRILRIETAAVALAAMWSLSENRSN